MKKLGLNSATDAELLNRFEQGRDRNALAELIQRYEPMVRATVRRKLEREHDVEDALQATFFALAKLAGSLRRKAAIAGWLHKTAVSMAMEIRRADGRWERNRERVKDRTALVQTETTNAQEPIHKVANDELSEILDEELTRLPKALHEAVVLCDLQGKTQKAAAAQLGIAASTVNDRVSKARRILRDRLIRRGISLTIAGLATCVASSVRPASAAAASSAELANAATLYVAGTSASEIGASIITIQTTNKVIASMTLAKAFTLGMSAVAILLLTGTLASIFDSNASTADAGTLFLDRFDDMSIDDGDPVTWVSSPFNDGNYDASSGDLVIKPSVKTKLDGTSLGVGVRDAVALDMSIQAQVLIEDVGDGAWIAGRNSSANFVNGYAAVVGYDPGFGGSFLSVFRVDGTTIDQMKFFPAVDGGSVADLQHDVRDVDTVVQLDIFGDEILAWAWAVGEQKPDLPQFKISDAIYSEPGFPAVGLSMTQPTGNPSNHGAIFRYVHVSTPSIPEPSTGGLAMLSGWLCLWAVVRHRRS